MRHGHPGRWLLALAIGLAVGFTPQVGFGQGKFTKVKFQTADKVWLQGQFYASAKGADGACVLMLHELGGSMNQKNWQDLAAGLQAKGFAVLIFDFRGHGKSTTVDEDFWKNPINQGGVKGYNSNPEKMRLTITARDFHPTYYLNLINDISAAKAYLDSLNDQNKINSANLILIGAKEGATLGALWMREEWYRFPVNGPQVDFANPCGRDVVGAMWLSISSKVGASTVPLVSTLKFNKERKVPMAFLYGEKDRAGHNIAESLLNVLNPRKQGKRNEKLLIGSKKIKDAEKAKGRELLSDDLRARDFIVSWLSDLLESKNLAPYEKRDFKRNMYVWKFNGAGVKIAKERNDRTLVFMPPIAPWVVR